MKKVLFLITSLGGGGAERVLINLVNNLDRNKYDITVQTIFDIGTNKVYLDKHIKYIPGLSRQFRGNSHLQKIFSPKRLYKMFIKERYDILISYLEGPPVRILAGCPYDSTKKIAWIHVEQNNRKRAAESFRTYNEAKRCYSSFDRIACVSKTVKEDFCSLFEPEIPVEVFYNTNDTERIIEKSKQPFSDVELSKEVNVFSIGRLNEQKGYDRLIKVHRKLLDEGYHHHVYVLGTGILEKELKHQCTNLKVDGTFHFLGYKENPYAYLAKADVFVCSSYREGFSTAVTESLILGIPCVSTNCSGAEELLGMNNEHGIVVDNSEDGIYWGVKQLLLDTEKRAYYQKKAIERSTLFSTEVTVKKVDELLEKVVNE